MGRHYLCITPSLRLWRGAYQPIEAHYANTWRMEPHSYILWKCAVPVTGQRGEPCTRTHCLKNRNWGISCAPCKWECGNEHRGSPLWWTSPRASRTKGGVREKASEKAHVSENGWNYSDSEWAQGPPPCFGIRKNIRLNKTHAPSLPSPLFQQCRLCAVNDNDGLCLWMAGPWASHYADCDEKDPRANTLRNLNLTNPPSMIEAKQESTFISLGEVTEVAKQLHSGKAPGVDEIRPEIMKALGVEGPSWLTRLINIAWKSGAVLKEWQTRVVVPLFKKGDQRVCANYRGITLLSLPGKVYSDWKGTMQIPSWAWNDGRAFYSRKDPGGGQGVCLSSLCIWGGPSGGWPSPGLCHRQDLKLQSWRRGVAVWWAEDCITAFRRWCSPDGTNGLWPSNTHWIGSQPSVKWLGWGSAPRNRRPWFSAGNRWTVCSE